MKQVIGRGAEAIIYKDKNVVTKHRVQKGYRHPTIDNSLRKFRTKREAKVLEKLQQLNFPGPKLHDYCDQEMKINMEFIEGEKLRDVFEKNHIKYSEEIGRKIGRLHKHDIIHADLTTSNMILKDEIFFIDFGLSFFSTKTEDKAVDLHLLERAIESKHHTVCEQSMKAVIEGYKKENPEHAEILSRLEKVKERGSNKAKH